MQPLNTIISIQNLTVMYHEKPVILNLNLQIPTGSMCAIVGPNGSGKTTLLKSILGIIQPITGTIKIFDLPLDKTKHKIAYVPQRNSVDWTFPVSVFDVVMMGRYGHLSWWQRPTKTDFEIVTWAMDQVFMTEYKNRHISQLSGGQQQRVFLARALAQQADIFILDEPFAGIDMVTETLILKLLQKLQNLGKTIIVVHHDIATVQKHFDWTLLMNIEHIASGPTEQTLTESNLQKTFHSSRVVHDSI